MGFFSDIIGYFKNMKKSISYKSMSKEELLKLSDEEFYDAVECVVNDAVYDIDHAPTPRPQRLIYALIRFEAEVNNGGLCQFFVNSSSECAPYISEAAGLIGADNVKSLYDDFISENGINVNDLSSFKLSSAEEFSKQESRYDFDSFDEKFYADTGFHKKIIDYSRENIDKVIC